MKAFMEHGEDFIVEHDLATLVYRMNVLIGRTPLSTLETVDQEIRAHDRQLDNPFGRDMQRHPTNRSMRVQGR
jgi:uncharacterized protein